MANGQQQAARGAYPEDLWMEFIKDMYPDLDTATYFFPPLFFGHVPYKVADVAGQSVLVHPASTGTTDTTRAARNPQPSPSPPPPPPPQQVAGTVFVENPVPSKLAPVQDSDTQDDMAQRLCLDAFSRIPGQAMMVVTSLQFRKYLDNQNNPQKPTNALCFALAQLPSAKDRSFPRGSGDCDFIILHRNGGVFLFELKAIADRNRQFFYSLEPVDQTELIIKKVRRAVKQLKSQEASLRYLVKDMVGGVRVTTAVLLPNVPSDQLTRALKTDSELTRDLCDTLGIGHDVDEAVRRCLCSEGLGDPETWWENLMAPNPDPNMSLDRYKRLVARFCGPASSVEIPTVTRPRKVLRAFGEAVAETGLRFAYLVLTPTQVRVLNEFPEPPFVHLQGPPGCGKTVALMLKAQQWARQDCMVLIVQIPGKSEAVALLVEEQLCRSVRPRAGRVQRLSWNPANVDASLAHMERVVQVEGRSAPVFVLFDEVELGGMDRSERDRFIQWLRSVHQRLPDAVVWSASVWRLDSDLNDPPPRWVQIVTLRDSLRCPPKVTDQVERSFYIDDVNVPKYCPLPHPPADGPVVDRLQHRGQPDHSGDRPWQCQTCSERVASALRRILAGQQHFEQPGHPQYRDMWVLCQNLPDPSHCLTLVSHLRQHVPVRAVPRPPGDEDARDLALALRDEVVVTDVKNVRGLERRVVIALGFGVDDFEASSRSTSFLLTID